MPNMVSMVTGPVVGLRSTWFLEDCVNLSEKAGRNITVFDLFDELLELEGFKPHNAYEKINCIGGLVDGYHYQFQLMREKAYIYIGKKINELDDNANVLIRAPLSIEWRGFVHELKDYAVIAKVIKPDRIVTLIDAEWKIYDRLSTDYGKYTLEKIIHANDRVSLNQILRWLGSEVSRSEDLAGWVEILTGKKVGHYVLSVETPSFFDRNIYVRDVDNMVKFATEKNPVTFYVSYSMTVADDDIRAEINNTICKLRNYGAVIDPAAIELPHGSADIPCSSADIPQNSAGGEEDPSFSYTICRDLLWFVKKADIVAAFHPYTGIPPLSTGMMDELGHAKAYFKERYLVLGSGAGSPFTGGNYIPKENLFGKTEEFFNFIENGRTPAIKPVLKGLADLYAAFQKNVMDNVGKHVR